MGKAIGIDLGTTNSAAAIDEGQVRVLPTRANESLTPSLVSYRRPRTSEQSGIILVGRAAHNNARTAPEQTVMSVKRLMGRTVDDPKVAEVRARYPYAITTADDEDDRGVRITLNDVKYSPVDISAMILRTVVEDAEKALGASVTHAVITVPAYFSEAQRAATREAGVQANLVVKKIIDEPTAAAIAFGMDRSDERHRVLVYDLGGGTFDISIIQMVNEQFQVLTTEGDSWLGGDDFDREIITAIVDWIKEQYNFDPSQDPRFLMAAKQKAEEAKMQLGGQPEVDLNIPAAARTPDREVVDVVMVLEREWFERAIQPYVDRSMALVQKALSHQHLTPDEITAVLLVGGSTAIPLVQQAVANMFGEAKVKRYLDPMQCVALGAGILAARLAGVECPSCKTVNPEEAAACSQCGTGLAAAHSVGSIGLGEVTARSLGIGVVGRDGRPGAYAVIIPKGTQYPLARPMERIFYTLSEDLIRVRVYEGEDPHAAHNDPQGTVEFQVPDSVKPGSAVTVQFGYDKDRVVTVGIRVHDRPDLQYQTVLTRDRARGDVEPEEEDWRRSLQGVANAGETFLERYREYMDQGAAKKMEEDIRRARQVYADGNKPVGVQLTEALNMSMIGSGVASTLHLADRVMDGATPEQVERLSVGIRKLREAHHQGNLRELQQLSSALQALVLHLIRQRTSQTSLEDRDYRGELQEGI